MRTLSASNVNQTQSKRQKDYLFDDGGIIAQCEFGPGAGPENVYEVFAACNRLTAAR